MAPPSYPELGKDARDVFSKGYHFGLIKLDVKTKTASGVEFNSNGSSNHESGKVEGAFETKYRVKDYGVTFTERWSTDNTLSTSLEVKDQLVQGLRVLLEGNFSPQVGSKSGALKAAFNNDYVHVNAASDFNVNGPLIQASAVVGHQGWLAGYQTAFDSENSKITKNNIALGFSTSDFIVHTNVDDGQEFGGAIYQKLNDKLRTGVQLAWSASNNETKFGIGASYTLDQDASLRAKINNSSLLGLGYQQRLRPGVNLYLSLLIDGKNFNSGGHKVGLSLELEG